MKKYLFIFLFLLSSSISYSQDLGHGLSGLPHGIPDFCASNTDTTSCWGIHNTWTLTGTLTVDVLLVYPEGSFICNGGTIIIRNRPINTVIDPEQFGQGIIAFGNVTMRGCTIKSESATGTRGHVLLTQRGDVDIQDSKFIDLGRTTTAPLDSTTWVDGKPAHIGKNQIGRYSLHLHHLMGPFPATKPYQFRLVNNQFINSEKWSLAVHNSSFGLIQGNTCTKPTAVCFVEEDGSETANQWIGNYAGQATGALCPISSTTGTDYDPEGRCPAGFWLRSMHQVLKNNVIEDMQRGITWWTQCLETNLPPCGSEALITIPKFPGADTTNPTQLQLCIWEGRSYPCRPYMRRGMAVDGNIIRRATIGFEAWWTGRIYNGAVVITGEESAPTPLITNSKTEDVLFPIHPHYSDLGFDGFIATGCETLITQFNDASPSTSLRSASTMSHVNAICKDTIYKRIGQLAQAPGWIFSDSILTSPRGIEVGIGGQGIGLHSFITVERSTVNGPIFTVLPNGFEFHPAQTITLTASEVNGQSFVKELTASGLDSPIMQPIPSSPIIDYKVKFDELIEKLKALIP